MEVHTSPLPSDAKSSLDNAALSLFKEGPSVSAYRVRDYLYGELFPVRIDGKTVAYQNPPVFESFLLRLKNLPEAQSTAILCPMTGMERAFHFLQGFYSIVNPEVSVIPVGTHRFFGHSTLNVESIRDKERIIFFDQECCFTYERLLHQLWDAGIKQKHMRALRLNDARTLHVGGDMCITAVKRIDCSNYLSLSSALLEWRRGSNTGKYALPNYGLQHALGIQQYLSPDQPLSRLASLFDSQHRMVEDYLHFRREALQHGVINDLQRNSIEALVTKCFPDQMKNWEKFQASFADLSQAEFDEMLDLVLKYEESRSIGFSEIGKECGLRALSLDGAKRFALSSLPYHWERWPDPFKERASD